MGDLELILLILTGFYLIECAHWILPGAVVFVAHFGERHRLHRIRDHAILRNDHGGLLFGNLLPFGNSAQCQAWPLSLAPSGISSRVRLALTADERASERRWVRFEAIKSVMTEGRRLSVNGAVFATVATPELADSQAELLRRLGALPEAERGRAIEQALAKSLDADMVRKRYHALVRASWGLLIVDCALFALIFVAFPGALFWDLPIDFLTGVLLYLPLLGLVLVNYSVAARHIVPRGHRWRRQLMFLVSPADAIHARNSLFRVLLGSYHPLAVCRALSPRSTFEDFARQIVLDAACPLLEDEPVDPEPAQVEEWFRAQAIKTLLGYLQREDIEPSAILATPRPESPACIAYCPRCRGQYERGEGDCSGCHGIPLRRFSSPAASLGSGISGASFSHKEHKGNAVRANIKEA